VETTDIVRALLPEDQFDYAVKVEMVRDDLTLLEHEVKVRLVLLRVLVELVLPPAFEARQDEMLVVPKRFFDHE
jgi:hypothetical protein